MVTAGIDMGARAIKAIVLKDGNVLSRTSALTGPNQALLAEECLRDAAKQAGISNGQIERTTATGVGMKLATFASATTRLPMGARGARWLFPSARTVMDVGAEEARVTKLDAQGKVQDHVVSGRCSAAAGTFTEIMARVLEVDLKQLGELSVGASKAASLNAQCAVFAESEVVSLIHAKTPKAEIARAIHDAMATRAASLLRQVGIEKDVVLVGGMAKNAGFVDSLKRCLQIEILIPEYPEYAGALGAALTANDKQADAGKD